MKAAFLNNKTETIERVYSVEQREELANLCEFYPQVISADNLSDHRDALNELEIIFSSWGMLQLSEDEIADYLPNVKAVFYAAGSVKAFAEPFLRSGVQVFSAWAANAVPVAEFCLSQILLANKGYFHNFREIKNPADWKKVYSGPGNFDVTISLLGAGMIGRYLINLLRPFRLKVLVFDPFLSDAAAAELGVEKVTLADAFKRGQVVSNHLANVPETRLLLKEEHFTSMPDHAVFINTGRGATVDEAGLISALQERVDLMALLDVCSPEPPAAASPLYTLPNVLLSSHIAGSQGNEVHRMADYAIDEFKRWEKGEPVKYEVTELMLPTMA